jgi:hypothetical protein
LDSAAYKGAAGVEKKEYKWIQYETKPDLESEDRPKIIGESEGFSKATDAALFMERLGMAEIEDLDCWERVCNVVVGTEEETEKTVEAAVKDFVDTAKKLSKNKKIKIKGFLTDSGDKLKTLPKTENMYQFNREGKERPTHLEYARQYMLKKFPFVSMAKKGWEADTHCVGLAEKKGKEGVILSVDKDLKQAEDTNFIDMNELPTRRKILETTKLGRVWVEEDYKGDKVYKGEGFKFLCYQAAVGDISDGYKGLKGFGAVAGTKLLEPCKTKEECVQSLLEVYEKKLAKGVLDKAAKDAGIKPKEGYIRYLSWDGHKMQLNAKKLLQQHFELAYQERSPKDKFKLEDYL